MFSIITRRFAIAAVLLSVFAVAACGDKEPEQRKTFIEYLQKQVLSRKTAFVPFPNEKEKESFGPYANHYQVIVDFTNDMEGTTGVLNKFQELTQKMRSLQGIRDNWKSIEELRKLIADKVMPEAEAQFNKAESERKLLKQPDDLKVVYDQAFEKTVTQPVEAFKAALPAMSKAMEAMEALGRFLDENKDNITLSGMSVQPKKESLQKPLQDHLAAYNKASVELLQAAKPLLEITGTSPR